MRISHAREWCFLNTVKRFENISILTVVNDKIKNYHKINPKKEPELRIREKMHFLFQETF